MQHPKVVVIGAGSLFFGRSCIWEMIHSPVLQGGTLALVDVDADRLAKMKKLAELVKANHQSPLTIEASTNYRDVLRGADFVILSFAYRNAHFRGVDCTLSEKYGIRMCSGDTIGPGGVLRSLREFPQIIDICQTIEQVCPDAWVLNYINPTAVHGIGLRRHFPKLKSFALCDAQYQLRKRYAEILGVPNDDKLVVQSAGPNHFTWLLRVAYDGQDLLPKVIEHARAKALEDINTQAQGNAKSSKGAFNNAIALELYDRLGALPTVVGHTKEYVRYYQGLGKAGRESFPPLMLFEVPLRLEWTGRVWDRIDAYLSGAAPISEFDTEFGPDVATDIIASMWGNLGKRFFINTDNNGAISNLPDDAYLELYSEVDMNGPRPLPVGKLPVGIRGMCQLVLDTHELTAQAIYEGNRDLLLRALLVDPLTNSIGDAQALLDDLIEAEAEALPASWRPAVAAR